MHTTADPANSERSEAAAPWSYEDAFMRNLGLINPTEQQQLRRSHVAIAGMGGVGGIDVVALARLGIGKFTIADPDVFEVPNTNRQYGAMRSTDNRLKAEVMRDIIRDINPEAEVRVFCEHIGKENASVFLEGADLLSRNHCPTSYAFKSICFGLDYRIAISRRNGRAERSR
jgi:tRNA A37 threonylcarbamoyladenosine dehydratase